MGKHISNQRPRAVKQHPQVTGKFHPLQDAVTGIHEQGAQRQYMQDHKNTDVDEDELQQHRALSVAALYVINKTHCRRA